MPLTSQDPTDSLWMQGRWVDLIPIQKSLLAAARRDGDQVREADAWHCLSFLLSETGQKSSALLAARRDLRLRRRLRDPVEIARALSGLAAALDAQGQGKKGLCCQQAALEAYRRLEDWNGLCQEALILGRMLARRQRWDEALQVLLEVSATKDHSNRDQLGMRIRATLAEAKQSQIKD